VLFASVVFQLSPALFPGNLSEWAHGLPNRLAMAVCSVAVGVCLEKLIVEQLGFGTTPLPVSTSVLPLVLLGVTVVVVATRLVEPVRIDSDLLYTFEPVANPLDEAAGYLVASQQLLVVVFVGVLLAQMSLLFPLPELLILAAVGYDASTYAVGAVEEVPSRRDIAERVVQAALGIWYGPRGIVWAVYATAGLFAAFLIDYVYLEGLDVVALLSVRPKDALFAIYVLVGMTTLVAIASIRLAERIPAQLQERRKASWEERTGVPWEKRAEMSWREDRRDSAPAHDSSVPTTKKRRLPGFMIPAGLLVMCLELARPNFTGNPPVAEVPPLALSGPILALAAVAGVVGVATVVRPSLFPSSGLSDYAAAPVSVACFFTLGLGIGFANVSNFASGTPMELARTGGNVVMWLGVTLSPFVGYEMDPLEEADHIGTGIVDGIVGSGVLLVGFLLVSGLVALLFPTSSLSPVVYQVALTAFALSVVFLGAVLGVRLLLVVPYLGEVLDHLIDD
jgi:hypothetical protein